MSAWTDLGEGALVRQSRVYRMNSGVLLDPDHAVIVDPGVLPSELDEIAALVREVAPAATTIVLTHGHWDHVLGLPWFPDAETLAHDRLAGEVARDRDHVRAEADRFAQAHGESWPAPFAPFRPARSVSGLHFARLDPWRVVLRDAPGHSDSQLTLHVPERRLLFAADMLSDIEIPELNQPPAVYRATVEALLPLAQGGAIETLVPGHGSIATGRDAVLARLRADLDYLGAIERGAGEALAAGLALEKAQERLRSMDYAGRRSEEYPTEPIHLENVAIAYRAAAGATGAKRAPRA
jgi:glyoxylase-like metal-dependent hydrolase (beta-lactamase superfamily II)